MGPQGLQKSLEHVPPRIVDQNEMLTRPRFKCDVQFSFQKGHTKKSSPSDRVVILEDKKPGKKWNLFLFLCP